MSKLFLIPNLITEEGFGLPANIGPAIAPSASVLGTNYICNSIAHIRTFFVEEPKSARRLLKHLSADFPLQSCRYYELSEHTSLSQIKEYTKLLDAEDCGIISESGTPCVADPGAELVLLAHQNGVKVVPLVGPSSILLALMASGLNGQNFAFNGYLPKDGPERLAKIKALEQKAAQEGQAQIFMETPYRNQNVFDDLLAHCDAKTFVCVACDLTGPQQYINTKTVGDWKKTGLILPRKPALFIINK